MTQDAISRVLGASVSHETFERLDAFIQNLLRWNKTINLVSRSTEADIWSRHVLDSVQLASSAIGKIKEGRWLDIGSGGGFPGMVLAIIAKEIMPGSQFVLVESDQRKAAFLTDSARLVGAECQIISRRIEGIAPVNADVVTARAFAPLDLLLELAKPHMGPDAIGLFLKGASAMSEVSDARKTWNFDVSKFESKTQQGAWVLKLSEISYAD